VRRVARIPYVRDPRVAVVDAGAVHAAAGALVPERTVNGRPAAVALLVARRPVRSHLEAGAALRRQAACGAFFDGRLLVRVVVHGREERPLVVCVSGPPTALLYAGGILKDREAMVPRRLRGRLRRGKRRRRRGKRRIEWRY